LNVHIRAVYKHELTLVADELAFHVIYDLNDVAIKITRFEVSLMIESTVVIEQV